MPVPLTVSCSSKSRLVLPIWYRLTRVVLEKRPLNGCSCSFTRQRPFCKMAATAIRGQICDGQISRNICNILVYMFAKFGPFITKCTILWIFELCCPITGKMVIVSCAPFALHFCSQRCRSRQMIWIIIELCIGRLMSAYCQQISNCCRPVLTYWLTDWRHRWLTDCW